MRKLEDRLAANGCDRTIEQVQDILVELLEGQFSAWTVDELLLHPRDAAQFCDSARRKLAVQDLPDDLVLRCLLTRRKNP